MSLSLFAPPRANLLHPDTHLLLASPVLDVLHSLTVDAATIERLAPGSDAVLVLRTCIDRLKTAVSAASEAEVWVSTKETARLRGRTTAAITRQCRIGALRCRKRGGAWEIHKDSVLVDSPHPRAA